jgi:hypothetical protein
MCIIKDMKSRKCVGWNKNPVSSPGRGILSGSGPRMPALACMHSGRKDRNRERRDSPRASTETGHGMQPEQTASMCACAFLQLAAGALGALPSQGFLPPPSGDRSTPWVWWACSSHIPPSPGGAFLSGPTPWPAVCVGAKDLLDSRCCQRAGMRRTGRARRLNDEPTAMQQLYMHTHTLTHSLTHTHTLTGTAPTRARAAAARAAVLSSRQHEAFIGAVYRHTLSTLRSGAGPRSSCAASSPRDTRWQTARKKHDPALSPAPGSRTVTVLVRLGPAGPLRAPPPRQASRPAGARLGSQWAARRTR